MIRHAALLFALTLAPAAAAAQGMPTPPDAPSPAPASSPSPAASPTPAASSTPSAIGPAFGQNDPCTTLLAIVTRPTVTNSVCTVRPNHVLVETGYQNTSFEGSGNTVVYPQTLVRVGTALPKLELQISPPSISRSSFGGTTLTGSTDTGVGLKYVFGYGTKANWGGQISFTAPTGLNGVSAGAEQSMYSLNAGLTISPVFSLATTLSTQSLASAGTRYTSFVPSLVLAAGFPAGSATTNVYAEIAQFTHGAGPGTATRTQYIGGVSRDVGQKLQLDVEYGYSPTVATGKYRYVGAGVSYYF